MSSTDPNSQSRLYTPLNVLKFAVFSLFGMFLFFIPIKVNQVSSIPIDHLIALLHRFVPLFGPIFTLLIVLVGGVLPWIQGSYKKDVMSLVMALFRTAGIPIVLIAFLHHVGIATIGPKALMRPDMLPFLFAKVVMAVSLIVPIGSAFLTFILGYGLLEFIGVLVRPVMRPVYRTPGEAAVNAVAAFVGSFSVAIFFTDKMYLQSKYTNRESVIIMTGFSTVSATFMIIIAKTAQMMPIWNFYFWSTLVITFLVTAITIRLWPITRVSNGYLDGRDHPDPPAQKGLLSQAVREGLEVAAAKKTIWNEFWDNLKGGMRMIFVLAPSIASFGLLAFVLVKMTPAFDIVGYLFAPFTYLLGLIGFPEPMMVAKASAVVLGEMFVPNLLVASGPMAVRYVIGVVSVSAILFFSGSIPCILASHAELKLWQILVIWFQRTVLSIVIAGVVALIAF